MVIYTDGSCTGNGKAENSGGFGVLVLDKDKKNEYNIIIDCYSKHSNNTTNNREEIKAILYSFFNYGVNINNKEFVEIPVVYSDSAYAVNTLTDWMFRWAANGWIKSDKKIPENLDLIQAYYDWYQKGYRIELRKVKGHAGNKYNEIVDKLATGKITVEEIMNG